MTIQWLQDELREKMREERLSVADLSQLSGVSRPEIYKLLKGEVQEPSPYTLRRLARPLHDSPTWLLRRTYDRLPPLERDSRLRKYRVGYSSGWVESTTPDNIPVVVNQRFFQSWEIQNDGDESWHHFSLVNVDDSTNRNYIRPDQSVIPLPDEVKPGDTVIFNVWFTAPSFGGPCRSIWRLLDENGDLVFPDLSGIMVEVTVQEW